MSIQNLLLADQRMIFWPETLAGQIIVIIIFGLLFFSIVVFFQHWERYKREIGGVDRVSRKLDEWINQLNERKKEKSVDDDIDEDNEDIVYQPTVDIHNLLEGLSSKLIIYDRLFTLDKLKTARVKVNIDVLQKLSLAVEAKEWTLKVPGYVMTLAMLLGVFGTFYGLSEMVLEIGNQLRDLSNADIDQFSTSLSNMQGVLSGAGTAFSTTLTGLTCTIIVSLCNFRLGQKQAEFYDHLESFTAEKLLPSAFPDLEEGDVLDQISDRLKDSFEELNDTIDKNNETIENLNGVYQRFDEIIDNVKKITASESSTQVKAIISEMNGINLLLKEIVDKYENKRILQEIQELEDSNKQFVEKYNNLIIESSWIPHTKMYLIVITVFLFLIMLGLTYNTFFS